MDENKVKIFFSIIEEDKIDFNESKKMLQEIIETIENLDNYYSNKELLKIYALSTGKFFTRNGLKPWEMAEKSVCASESYLTKHPMDYEVNSIYLLLTNLTFKFEQSYQKAMSLYQSGDESLKILALQFLSLPDFYQEGIITKNEYESYNDAYQVLKSK